MFYFDQLTCVIRDCARSFSHFSGKNIIMTLTLNLLLVQNVVNDYCLFANIFTCKPLGFLMILIL